MSLVHLTPIDDSIFQRGGDAAEAALSEREQQWVQQRQERDLQKGYLYICTEGGATRAVANPKRMGVRHISSEGSRNARGGETEQDLRNNLIKWTMAGLRNYPFEAGVGRAASVDALREDMVAWAEQRNQSYWYGGMIRSKVEAIVEFCHGWVVNSRLWNEAPQYIERTPDEWEEFREKQRDRARNKRTRTEASIAAARRNGSHNSLQAKAEKSEEVARLLYGGRAMSSREDRWAAAEKLAEITGLTAEHIFKRNLATPRAQTRDAQAQHRAEVLAYVEAGNSQRAAGRHFGVSEGAIRKLLKRARQDRQEAHEEPMDTTHTSQPEPVRAPQEVVQQAVLVSTHDRRTATKAPDPGTAQPDPVGTPQEPVQTTPEAADIDLVVSSEEPVAEAPVVQSRPVTCSLRRAARYQEQEERLRAREQQQAAETLAFLDRLYAS